MDNRMDEITASLIDQLKTALGEQGVLTSEAVSARQSGYFDSAPIAAKALLRPASTSEVAAALRLCSTARQVVVPFGGLTNLVHNTTTLPTDMALSLERMNAIEEIDLMNRSMIVQAGAALQKVQESASEAGLFFPLDLTARGSAAIGGLIANNAGGMRVLRYGMMRSLVLGLEAVLADGTVLTSMNKMLKNNAGYDLKQLFIGSEGTLGVVTRAVLRLWPNPRSHATALVSMHSFSQVSGLLALAQAEMGEQLASFEVMWNDFYRLTTTPPAQSNPPISQEFPFYVLLETLEAGRGGEQQVFASFLDNAYDNGLFSEAVVAKTGAQRSALWRIREDSELIEANYHPSFSFDVSLPVSAMERYVEGVQAALFDPFGKVKCWVYGHVADGNLHLNIWGEAILESDHSAVEQIVYRPLSAVGGSVSAEHGIGLDKKPYLHLSRTPEEIVIMRRIKAALDPYGILNPGKIFDLN